MFHPQTRSSPRASLPCQNKADNTNDIGHHHNLNTSQHTPTSAQCQNDINRIDTTMQAPFRVPAPHTSRAPSTRPSTAGPQHLRDQILVFASEWWFHNEGIVDLKERFWVLCEEVGVVSRHFHTGTAGASSRVLNELYAIAMNSRIYCFVFFAQG